MRLKFIKKLSNIDIKFKNMLLSSIRIYIRSTCVYAAFKCCFFHSKYGSFKEKRILQRNHIIFSKAKKGLLSILLVNSIKEAFVERTISSNNHFTFKEKVAERIFNSKYMKGTRKCICGRKWGFLVVVSEYFHWRSFKW